MKVWLPTRLRELPHLAGAVVGQTGDGAQRGLPVAAAPLGHVADEGVQQLVGGLPEGGRGTPALKDMAVVLTTAEVTRKNSLLLQRLYKVPFH